MKTKHLSTQSTAINQYQSLKSWSRTFQVKDIRSFFQCSIQNRKNPPIKKMVTQPSNTDRYQVELNLSGLKKQTIKNNMDFIYKKLQSLEGDSISQYKKLYRSKSKQTPILKKQKNRIFKLQVNQETSQEQRPDFYNVSMISQKYPYHPIKQKSARSSVNTSKTYSIKNNLSIKLSHQSPSVASEQKRYSFFAAQEKTQNQRILRLLQKQQQSQQRYSAMKTNLLRKMQQNASKRISKRFSYCFRSGMQKSIQLKSVNINPLNRLK